MPQPGRYRTLLLVGLVLALPALAGCTDNPVNSGSEQSAEPFDASSKSNQPGSFSYSGAMALQTKSEDVAWTSPAPRAQVSWSGAVAEGSFTMTVSDHSGERVVYEKTIDGTVAGTFQESTDLGVPGEWTLSFEFQSFTGTMDLSVQSG